MADKSLHTVTLDADKCKGCVTCMRRCPTEAIRVRNGKAKVYYERCIGCGECVRLCPHHAKKAAYDPFEIINNFKYKIALPAPSLYGQYNNMTNLDYVLNGLLKIGFDDVFEVGRGAELVSEATNILLGRDNLKKPIISTACPAVLELIMLRFNNLKDNLLRLLPPVDIAAKLARERAIERGIPAEDIGVFFISPCPAKVYALKTAVVEEAPVVDGVLSVSDVYLRTISVMNNLTDLKPLSKMGVVGLQWASSGGEAFALHRDKYLAANGMENVINILKSIERSDINDIEFIELNACVGGCVGGVLNIENAFVTKARLRALRRTLPEKSNVLADEGKSLAFYQWSTEPDFGSIYRLDGDRAAALNKMIFIENKLNSLPQIDCGLCGAPSCRAFAEDIANGVLEDDAVCPKMQQNNGDW